MAKRIQYSNIDQTIQSKSNTLDEFLDDYITGYISDTIAQGSFSTITLENLTKYLASPDKYYKEISNIIKYEYISNGDIYQLHTLLTSLPTLNYKLISYDNSKKGHEKNQAQCYSILSKARYKQLTRELISQLCAEGTVVCMWLGDKKNTFLYIFNNLQYVFPAYRRNGDWICMVDMGWFDEIEENERRIIFETLSPYVTESDYKKYQLNKTEYQYKELPQERTCALRVNTMSRNQRLGLPMGTQSLFDLLHKQTLKNLEKSISEKIINNIAVLTVGNKEKPNEQIPKKLRQTIGSRVMKILQQSVKQQAIGLVTLPEYASLEWSKIDGLDALDNKKFESINSDISTDLGISPALTNGTGGNGSTAKYNMETLYRRVGVILEEMDLVFNKLLALSLGKVSENFMFEFEKEVPLTKKEQLEALTKLQACGYSTKYITDMLSGVDFNSYVAQSLYEIETLELRDKITPPQTSSTLSSKDTGDDKSGAPIVEDPDSEETIKSQDTDKRIKN